MWLTCSLQNARLTAGAVLTLEVARAAVGAISATRTEPMTELASVSNHISSRFDNRFFRCRPMPASAASLVKSCVQEVAIIQLVL